MINGVLRYVVMFHDPRDFIGQRDAEYPWIVAGDDEWGAVGDEPLQRVMFGTGNAADAAVGGRAHFDNRAQRADGINGEPLASPDFIEPGVVVLNW